MMNLPLKNVKNGMVTPLTLKSGNSNHKIKPCKYSILKTKVTGVFPSHLLLFSEYL